MSNIFPNIRSCVSGNVRGHFGASAGDVVVPAGDPIHSYSHQLSESPTEENTDRAARWDGYGVETRTSELTDGSPIQVGGTGGAFSFSIWMYTPTLNTKSFWINYVTLGSNTLERNFALQLYVFGQINARLRYTGASTSALSCTQTGISTATWYHLLLVFDPTAGTDGRFYFYVNGAASNGTSSDDLPSGTYPHLASAPLMVGGNSYQTNISSIWNGNLLCASHYSRVLTSGERSYLYNSGTPLHLSQYSGATGTTLSTDCTGFYAFTEAVGAPINDLTGLNPDFDLYTPESADEIGFDLPGGLPVTDATLEDLVGDSDGASGEVTIDYGEDPEEVYFDGTDDFMPITFGSSISSPYTLQLLVTTDSNSSAFDILNADRGSGDDLRIYRSASSPYGNRPLTIDFDNSATPSGIALTNGSPMLIFITVAADGTHTAFFNNVEVELGAGDTDAIVSCVLGNESGQTLPFDGQILQFKVYDAALSAAQIALIVSETDGVNNFAGWSILGENYDATSISSSGYRLADGFAMNLTGTQANHVILEGMESVLTSGVEYQLDYVYANSGSVLTAFIGRIEDDVSTAAPSNMVLSGGTGGTGARSTTFTPSFSSTLILVLGGEISTPRSAQFTSIVITEA